MYILRGLSFFDYVQLVLWQQLGVDLVNPDIAPPRGM